MALLSAILAAFANKLLFIRQSSISINCNRVATYSANPLKKMSVDVINNEHKKGQHSWPCQSFFCEANL
ncbi:hypothetical protein DXX93_15850 [Thalassotalea euphylliae]|uniref:Uncharacterized protein n=1 Tax=Thalassotalea euphylliae TaxID=1655234 RepID=A0A3E0TVC1_9GAMM|nr:hypothetical protein DXX93_15850 [Thalassotalea euphylliae]